MREQEALACLFSNEGGDWMKKEARRWWWYCPSYKASHPSFAAQKPYAAQSGQYGQLPYKTWTSMAFSSWSHRPSSFLPLVCLCPAIPISPSAASTHSPTSGKNIQVSQSTCLSFFFEFLYKTFSAMITTDLSHLEIVRYTLQLLLFCKHFPSYCSSISQPSFVPILPTPRALLTRGFCGRCSLFHSSPQQAGSWKETAFC